jgi:hypothetical protein
VPTVTNIGLAAPGVGALVPLDERLGRQREAGKLIGADLHQPYLDGVTAHIDRGSTRRALSHSSRLGRRHP